MKNNENFDNKKVEPIYSEKEVEKTPESLDAKWYEKINNMPDTEAFKWLGGDNKKREEVKEKTEEAYKNKNKQYFNSVEFKLDYPKVENIDFDIDKNIKELNEMKKKLEAEKDPMIRDMYNYKCDEKIAEFEMIKAVKEKDDISFNENCLKVYGEPRKDFFDYTIAEMMQDIEKNKDSFSEEQKIAYERLLNNFNKEYIDKTKNIEIKKPKLVLDIKDLASIGEKTAFATARELVGTLYKASDVYKSESIKKDFENYLLKSGINTQDTPEDKKWKVILADKTTFSVDQDKREISVPNISKTDEKKQKALYSIQKDTLKLHEAGTHALRGSNGEKSGIKLLRYGLAGYERGEEGVATFNQQMQTGVEKFAGFDGYLAIGLAKGIDGKEKRGMEKVREILSDYYLLAGDSLDQANKKAWSRCVRTFRGIDKLNNNEGYCFTKDMVYREGNMAVWDIVNKVKERFGTKITKKFISTFSLGKWDPTNPKHYEIITRIKTISQEQADVLNQVYSQIFKKS